MDHHSAASRGDGGMDFTPLCKQQGCTFVLCPPANDRWHPWPFFKRLVDAAQSLKTEYVTLMASTGRIGCFRSTHLPEGFQRVGPLEANCVILRLGGEWDEKTNRIRNCACANYLCTCLPSKGPYTSMLHWLAIRVYFLRHFGLCNCAKVIMLEPASKIVLEHSFPVRSWFS